MSTRLIESKDENKIEYTVHRFCTSEKHAKKTNGDKVRISINIYNEDSGFCITLSRNDWEDFKQKIDEGFAEFPVDRT